MKRPALNKAFAPLSLVDLQALFALVLASLAPDAACAFTSFFSL